MKKLYILALCSFLLTSCGDSKNYDGLWLIEKDKSTAACLLALQEEDEKEVSEDEGIFGGDFMEGFSKLLCEGVVAIIPVLDIKDNKFNYSIMQMSATCTINPTKNTVSCLPDEEIKNLAEEGSPVGIGEVSGDLRMEEDFLVWNMSQETQENKKEFLLFYKQRK